MSTQVHQHLPEEAFSSRSQSETAAYKHSTVSRTSRRLSPHKFLSSSSFFCLRSCWETYTAHRETSKSWISPKSSRSVWICVSISRGCSQHVQLPLKISMEPTSTEAAVNLQPLCSCAPLCAAVICSSCPSTFLVHPLLHPRRLALTDNDGDERTVCVKGSSASSQSHQSQFHFVTCLWQPSRCFNVTLTLFVLWTLKWNKVKTLICHLTMFLLNSYKAARLTGRKISFLPLNYALTLFSISEQLLLVITVSSGKYCTLSWHTFDDYFLSQQQRPHLRSLSRAICRNVDNKNLLK